MLLNFKSKPASFLKRTWKYALFAVLSLSVIFTYWYFTNKPQIAAAGWWNESWSYRKAIVVNHEKVAGDLTSFPMLVSLTDTNLGTHAQADGDDIVFIAQNGEKLKHEIESFATTTGVLVAWVKMPALSSTADQTIYMYYGNSSVGSQQDAVNLWSNDYVGVWHMPNSATASTTDSSGKQAKGIIYGHASTTASGKSDGAFQFDGTGDDYIVVPDSNSLSFGNGSTDSTFSISAWIKMDANSGFPIVVKGPSLPDLEYFFRVESGTNLYLRAYDASSNYIGRYSSASMASYYGQWAYVVATYSGNKADSGIKLYLNNSRVDDSDAGSGGFAGMSNTTSNVDIGRYVNYPYYADGLIDEVRISSRERSLTWIQTEYNNQASTTEFLKAQAEETGPGPVGYWTFDEGYGATANDESGQENHGTITGATWQDESMCVSGKCLYFDGTNSRVNCGSGSSLDNMQSFTYSAWIKPNSWGENSSGHIIDKLSSPSTDRKQFRIRNDASPMATLRGYVSASTPGFANAATGTIALSEWQHVAMSFDINGDLKIHLYINGLEAANYETQTTANPLVDDDDAGNLIIGDGANNLVSFHGFIDEVKIYPYARSADQVRQDYAAGLAGIGTSQGVAAAFGSKSDSWMTDGLVGYWKMDEPSGAYDADSNYDDAQDASGNGNTGSAVGNASTTAGKFGNGYVGDGNGDYINAFEDGGANDFYDYETGESISFSFWSRPRSLATSDTWLAKGDNYGVQQSDNNGSDARLRFFFDNGSGWSMYESDDYVYNLSEDVWQHIVFSYTFGQGDSARIYLNGDLVVSHWTDGTGNEDPETDDDFLWIGRSAAGEYFDGRLDEVRIYNRALSADEVRKLYEWAPEPVAHWKFDEHAGTTAYDSAASTTFSGGNHGTLYNNPLWDRGKYNGAIKFNTTSQQAIDVPAASSTDPESITVSLWFKRQGVQTNPYGEMIVKGSWLSYDFDAFSYAMEWDTDGDGTQFNWDVSTDVDGYNYVQSGFISDNTWTHAAGTFNTENNLLALYINGILVGSNTKPGKRFYHSAGITFGCYGNGGCYNEGHFNGLIDDVRIYNYARTQKQILEDMNGGKQNLKSTILNLKFDEGKGGTAYDSSGYGNNGTMYPGTTGGNTATSAMWDLNGKFGKAIEFDGNNDYVNLGAPSELADLGPLTISAWIFPRTLGGASRGRIVDKAIDTGAGNGYIFIISSTNSVNSIQFWRGYSDTALARFSAPDTVSFNTWQHVVVTWDGTSSASSVHFYKNGVETGYNPSVDGVGTLSPDIGSSLRIGNSADFSRGFDGLIDEVKIYPYALSENEIKTDYNRGMSAVMGSVSSATAATSSNAASRAYCVPGSTDYCAPPVGEWKFDEMAGTTIYDTSGNGNDGNAGYESIEYMPGWKTVGKYGSALMFDGEDDFITRDDEDLNGSVPAKSSGGAQSFTLSAWVNAVNTFQRNPLLVKQGTDAAAPSRGFLFSVGNEDSAPLNRLEFQIYKNEFNSTQVFSSPILENNVWQHVAVTYEYITDGTSKIRIYIDGINDSNGDSDIAVGPPQGNPQPLHIGRYWYEGYYKKFEGLVDQVRIYNYALTPAQIAWEFNGGKPIAYWKFNECGGGTIYDSAASWNGGTANNGQLILGTTGVTATGTCASSSNSFWYNGRTGKVNHAGSFDGTDDYISLGTANIPTTNQAKTISAWVKTSTIEYNRIYDDNVMELSTNASGYFQGRVRGSTINTTNRFIADNSWHQVMASWDGSSVKNIYADGELVWTGTESTGGDLTTPKIGIMYAGTGLSGWNGLIDEVKIWNYALTAEQVKTEYAGGAVRFGN